jgi:hypothetical protein
MDDNDCERVDATSSCLMGLIDGVTGAVVLATIAAVYALVVDVWWL